MLSGLYLCQVLPSNVANHVTNASTLVGLKHFLCMNSFRRVDGSHSPSTHTLFLIAHPLPPFTRAP